MINDPKNKKIQETNFSKKKKSLEDHEQTLALPEETLAAPSVLEEKVDLDVKVEEPVSAPVSLEKKEVKKDLNVSALVNDIANNKYFPLTGREANSIAQKMIERGAEELLEIKWFLTGVERRELLKQLKEKHSL